MHPRHRALGAIQVIAAVGAAAFVVLAASAWPMFRLLSIPQIHREYRCVFYRVLVLIGVYIAVAAVLSIRFPNLAAACAAVALLLLAAERWRARPGYGSKRGLPPGSLGLVPRGPWIDDGFFLRQAEKYGPVFKLSQYFRPMVCVVGPAEGLNLLRAYGEKLYTPEVPFSARIPNGFLRYMSPANHRKYRPVFQAAMRQRVIRDGMPDVDDILRNGLAAFAARSRAQPDPGRHPGPALDALSLEIMLRLFAGVRSEPEVVSRFRDLLGHLVVGKAACRSSPKESEALDAVSALLRGRVERLVALERPCFLTELARQGPEAIDDPTVMFNLVYMLQNAAADFGGFLTWTVKLLIDNPEWGRNLRELSRTNGPEAGKVAESIVKESLRLERSEFIYRRAREDIRFHETLIPRGWVVRICIREGHRDSEVFENPGRFDPARFIQRSFSPAEYSPLGIGAHACLGASLIRIVGAAFVLQWCGSYDIVVLQDGPREFGRSHWQPSSALRVRLLECD